MVSVCAACSVFELMIDVILHRRAMTASETVVNQFSVIAHTHRNLTSLAYATPTCLSHSGSTTAHSLTLTLAALMVPLSLSGN